MGITALAVLIWHQPQLELLSRIETIPGFGWLRNKVQSKQGWGNLPGESQPSLLCRSLRAAPILGGQEQRA
jgi:hypothetical protein